MPSPFDFLFGLGEALAYIKKAVNVGSTFEELVNELTLKNVVIPTAQAQKAFNYLTNVAKPDIDYIAGLGKNALPNLARIPLSLTKQTRNFAYLVKVTGVNNLTQSRTQDYINISSNELLTKAQAEQMAADLIEGNGAQYDVDEMETSVEGIQQNMGGLIEP